MMILFAAILSAAVVSAHADWNHRVGEVAETRQGTEDKNIEPHCDLISSLTPGCSEEPSIIVAQTLKAPEGIVYCGGGDVKRQIRYEILDRSGGEWDALVTVDGTQVRAMTAYSYFGNSQPPSGFIVALLGEDNSEFLVFQEGETNWLEFGDFRYNECE
ncbi:hypothetical protein [Roseibium aggregatum]|uniref:hypothetical protein n=1 Tax=Roseibium aggregatum TaxID=187304 RepID=UPI003A96FCD6